MKNPRNNFIRSRANDEEMKRLDALKRKHKMDNAEWIRYRTTNTIETLIAVET